MIRTLKFALRYNPANSWAVGCYATQQNAAHNAAVDVLNREPELPKRSGRNHPDALNKRRADWKHGGFDVNIEVQNSFELHGRSATLAGKPDLITQRDGQAVIVDVKTGQESASHVVQVMIYLYAIPRALECYRTLKLKGQATYLDHTVRIPAEAVDDQFIQSLGTLIRRLAADKPPTRVPSRQECRFCDISAADCPDRVDEERQPEKVTTEDF